MGVWLIELTRAEHGIAAMRAIVPELQPLPSGCRSARLLSVVEKFGGNPQYAQAIDII
jgi:hypothetical protein